MARKMVVAIPDERTNSFAQGLLRGILRYAHDRVDWEIALRHGRSPSLQDLLDGWPQDGAINGAIVRVEDKETLDRAARTLNAPLVNTSDIIGDTGTPAVVPDNEAIGQLGAAYFLDNGLRRFAFYGRMAEAAYSVARAESFAHAARLAGCPCAVYDLPRSAMLALPSPGDVAVADWIASLEKPVGVLCANDRLGRHLIEHCETLGVAVPDQAAVVSVGNDDLLCGLCAPAMSSIPQNAERMGYEAAATLDHLMRGGAPPSHLLRIPPEAVIVRASSDVLAFDDPDVAKALRYIRANTGWGLGVKALLDLVGSSRRTLERRFIETLGRGPGAEITRVRRERAKMLLRQTNMPIAEVARAAGFLSPAYLTAQLHRDTGLSPTEYRRRSYGL